MLWAASIDGHLSSLVACHCTYLYLFNLFVYLANKLSLSLSPTRLKDDSWDLHKSNEISSFRMRGTTAFRDGIRHHTAEHSCGIKPSRF